MDLAARVIRFRIRYLSELFFWTVINTQDPSPATPALPQKANVLTLFKTFGEVEAARGVLVFLDRIRMADPIRGKDI